MRNVGVGTANAHGQSTARVSAPGKHVSYMCPIIVEVEMDTDYATPQRWDAWPSERGMPRDFSSLYRINTLEHTVLSGALTNPLKSHFWPTHCSLSRLLGALPSLKPARPTSHAQTAGRGRRTSSAGWSGVCAASWESSVRGCTLSGRAETDTLGRPRRGLGVRAVSRGWPRDVPPDAIHWRNRRQSFGRVFSAA